MKRTACLALVIPALLFTVSSAQAQMQWTVGGNAGLSLFEGTAGFHIGPMAELSLNRTMSVGSEFTLNTQGGTPILWYNYFKYFFTLQGTKLRPYADAGLMLDFVTGGPYFGLLFGGGVTIPVGSKLVACPELQMGPIFSVGGGSYRVGPLVFEAESATVFTVLIRGGIRYEL